MYLAVNKTCPDQSKMFYNSPANIRSLNIEMYVDCLVDNVDFDKKLINTVLGGIEKKQFEYSHLIIASGSNPIIPPII